MRRILLGWEIGENRGHVIRLGQLAQRLRAKGCTIAWAVSRLDLLEGFAQPGEPVFQAPLWPGLHLDAALNAPLRAARSHADVMGAMGLDRVGAFAHLLRAWDGIVQAARPDAVFADFAPALLCACRARIPAVTAGIGFALPPAHLSRFARFDTIGARLCGLPGNDDPDETGLLAEVNRGLQQLCRPALAALPQMFAADAAIVAAFRELDPYGAHRTEPQAAPFLSSWSPPAASPGNEIIAYWSDRLMGTAAFFEALGRIGEPVTVVAPAANDEQIARHSTGRVRIVTQPLHFARIARRARVVISNGNTGFVSAAMLAGLPQAVLPHDLQKQLVGISVANLGVGDATPLEGIDWAAWTLRIRALHADPAPTARARALSQRLVPRMARDPGEICASELMRLAS